MAKFCSNCGKAVNENAAFCDGCGNALSNEATSIKKEEQAEKIILEAKGSLVGGGVGKIILTNKSIRWSKSAANFAMIGIASLATKGSTDVSINDIISTDTFMFLGGAGLQVLANNGKKYKFGFNSKKDRDLAMSYIQEQIAAK